MDFFPQRPPVSPKIYAYELIGVASHRGYIKVGYTERDVDTRIREQTHTVAVPYRVLGGGTRVRAARETPAQPVVKGDATSASIGAASILAKVSRDRYMMELDKQYPQYQLAKHKGYPTKLHYELIEQYGIQPFYRRSFLKKQGYWPEGK